MSTARARFLTCIPILALATSLLAPASQAGPTIKLSGWVWGMKPGDAVTLSIQGPVKRQVNARPGGAWTADGLPSGQYKVVPRSPGYSFQPPVRSIKPGSGGLGSVNFRASPPAAAMAAPTGFAIRGRVRGLPAAQRVLVKASGPTSTQAMTKPGGLYTLTGLTPGTYRIEVQDDRYRTKPDGRTIKVTRANRTNIHFTAKLRPDVAKQQLAVQGRTKAVRMHTVRGHVEGLKALLHGCKTAAVVAKDKDGQTLRTKTMVSEDVRVCGRFILRNVPAGIYQISAHVHSNAFTRYEVAPASRKVSVKADVDGITFEVDQESQTSRRRRRR